MIVNRNAVTSFSPGLPRFVATLGKNSKLYPTAKRLCHSQM